MTVARYEGDEKRATKLHLDPTISWGHILTTVALIGTLLTTLSGVNNRLTLNESNTKHNRELIDRQERQLNKDRAELNQTITKMSEKIDRLILRLSK